jgi:nifR3 family TIM-barrel protein
MISSEAVMRNNKKTLKMAEFNEVEKPIVLQLFGGKPNVVAKAARIIFEANKNVDGIDINMGCPVPKIAGKSNAGASLMKDHDRAVKIARALKEENFGVPISVKTRLGWSREDEILEFAPKLEQAGIDAITIHGRTKTQGYSGSANWDIIARVKKILSIPVIANGDVSSRKDVQKCLDVTGADGVMIGRAALGNPWIFSGREPSFEEIKTTVLKHAKLHLEHYGDKFGLVTFRKHLLCYFKGIQGVSKIRAKLAGIITLEDLRRCLSEF